MVLPLRPYRNSSTGAPAIVVCPIRRGAAALMLAVLSIVAADSRLMNPIIA